MDSRHLDDDGLPVLCGLLQRVDQLPQILNGIDIVMGRRGNGVGTLRDHAGLGHISCDLGAGEMAADAGLCALPHLDLDGGAGIEILFLYAEPAGGDLHDGVVTVAIEILMEPAFAGVIIDAQLLRCLRQTFVGVVADGAIAHGGEQNRHRQLQLGRQVGTQSAVSVPADGIGLLAQKYPRLHRLPQGVDRRIGHLRGVDKDIVPVHRQRLGTAHRAEQYAAGSGLLIDLVDGGAGPVGVLPQLVVVFHDLQGVSGAEGHAALAIDAFALVAEHETVLRIIGVDAVGALLFTDAAAGAARVIADHLKFRADVVDGHQ